MIEIISCNCIVCAEEFNLDELQSVALSKINATNFKVCQACLDQSDPADDYRQVRDIVESYLSISKARSLFREAADILATIKKS